MGIAAVISFLGLLPQIIDKSSDVTESGENLYSKIKALLVEHGIDAENAELEKGIFEAAQAKARERGIADGSIDPTKG